jgi:L-ascorbate 6-phosphate lactonase
MITVINGGFNNLPHWEAAGIAGKIRPRLAVPCHYGMFAGNAVDPEQFPASLSRKAPGAASCGLAHGEPFRIEA